MMRSPGAYGVAVRRPDGSIAFQRGKVESLARRYPILKLPMLRGVAVLFQSLALGIRSLNFSAEQAMAGKGERQRPSATPRRRRKDKSNWAIAGSMAVGLGSAPWSSCCVPLWLTHLPETYVFGGLSSLVFNLVDGVLRAALLPGLHLPDLADEGHPPGVPVPRGGAQGGVQLREAGCR